MKISGRLIGLSGLLITSATATYARLGVGSVEAKVLFCLDGDPISSAEIGRRIGVDRAAISRAAQALQKRGLVTKSLGKSAYIYPTQEGAELARTIHLLSLERERRLFAGLSQEDQDLFLSFLGRIALNIPALYEYSREELPARGGLGGSCS
jgi:DNA-binding MarR family transcriptional regulator